MSDISVYLSLIGLISVLLAYKYKFLGKTLPSFLRNNNQTEVYELAFATASHWMFAKQFFSELVWHINLDMLVCFTL